KPKGTAPGQKTASIPKRSGAKIQSARERRREITKTDYETGKSHGLKITIFRISENNGLDPADPEQEFHHGDKFKVRLESNSPGYVYITNIASSGNTKLLFPDSKERNNHIDRGHRYHFPNTYNLQFTGEPGIEVLQLFLAQNPVPFFEEAVK